MDFVKKVKFLNFGRLPPGQFSLDFKKNSDLGYLNLYLQHILGASKSGKLDDPLGGGGKALASWETKRLLGKDKIKKKNKQNFLLVDC